MEYSIQKLEKSRVEIAVSVDKAEWKDLIQQAFIKNKSRFSIEGFRPGKVPFGVLAKRYGEEIFYEDAADLAIGKHYGDIVEKEKLNVVARPDVDINVIDADGLKFVCTVAVYPEFELGAYTGLKIKKVARRVKKEDVTAEIDREREANARFIDVTDRAVQEGDMIEFDYSGSVDGVKFDGGTAEKYTLTVGSKQFIPGFEDQLVGKKIGEKFDVNVTFPEDYHAEDLKGKAAKFECLIHTIKYKELPVADDEFAKDLGEFDTFKEYEASVKARLQKKADDEATAKEDEALSQEREPYPHQRGIRSGAQEASRRSGQERRGIHQGLGRIPLQLHDEQARRRQAVQIPAREQRNSLKLSLFRVAERRAFR